MTRLDQPKKKPNKWSQEEHEQFLKGLHRLGKGNWKAISVHFVPTRSATQVASHAQKYFIRKAAEAPMKRRPSVFDVHVEESDSEQSAPPAEAESPTPPTWTPEDHIRQAVEFLAYQSLVFDSMSKILSTHPRLRPDITRPTAIKGNVDLKILV